MSVHKLLYHTAGNTEIEITGDYTYKGTVNTLWSLIDTPIDYSIVIKRVSIENNILKIVAVKDNNLRKLEHIDHIRELIEDLKESFESYLEDCND